MTGPATPPSMDDDRDVRIGGFVGFLLRLYQRWPVPFLLVCAMPTLWVGLIHPIITAARTGDWLVMAIVAPFYIVIAWLAFLMWKLHRVLHRSDHE